MRYNYQQFANPNTFLKSKSSKISFILYASLLSIGVFVSISHSGIAIATALTLTSSLFLGYWQRAYKLTQTNYLALAFILFFICAGLSLIYTTTDLHHALHSLKKYMRFAYVPLLMVLFNCKDTRRTAINCFLISMLAICCLAYCKYFGWINVNGGGETVSPNELFMNRIETSFFLAFTAFISAHRYYEKSKFKYLFLLYFIFISSNLLLINTAKTGLYLYLILMGLFVLQTLKVKFIPIVMAAAVAGLVAISFLRPDIVDIAIKEPIRNIYQYQAKNSKTTTSIGARLTLAKHSLEIAAKNPWLGTGIGSHHTEYDKYDLPKFENGLEWKDPHNQYILVFFELGTAGLLLFLYILLAQTYASFKLPVETKYLAQGLVISYAFGNMCDSLMYLSSTGIFYAYFSGLLFAPLYSGNKLSEK